MGFEDVFKMRMRKRHGGHKPYGDYMRGHHDDRGGLAQYLHLLERAKKHRKLLLSGCAVTAIIVLILCAAALWAFVLLIKPFSKTLSSNGIKGVAESAKALLTLLWNGSGK